VLAFEALFKTGRPDTLLIRRGSSIYVPYPQPHARNQDIEQSSEVELALLAGTGVIMVAPSGFDWDTLKKQGEPFTAGQ